MSADVPEAKTPAPFWQQALTQYVLPGIVASLIGAVVTLYAAVNTERNNQRQYNTSFETALKEQLLAKQLFRPSGTGSEEQEAMTALLALQGLAETETQRRTLLLIAARALNAHPDQDSTGGPAARALAVLIGQIDDELARGKDVGPNSRLRGLVRTRAFMSLVTAGYVTDYYQDAKVGANHTSAQPTKLGDQQVGGDAKESLLLELTPRRYDGWIHVATWTMKNRFRVTSDPASAARLRAAVRAVQDPTVPFGKRFDTLPVDRLYYQHVLPVRLQPGEWLGETPRWPNAPPWPAHMRVLKPRLLHDAPPYVYADAAARVGTLGRVIGVVGKGSCVEVAGPPLPVVVFVPPPTPAPSPSPSPPPSPLAMAMRKPAPAASPSAVASASPRPDPNNYSGYIHLWVHVKPSSSDCGDTLANGVPTSPPLSGVATSPPAGGIPTSLSSSAP